MKRSKKVVFSAMVLLTLFVNQPPVYAMHIMEGFLSPLWAGLWFAVSLPFIVMGVRSIQRITEDRPNMKMILALCGAFVLVLSSLKLPSVTGSSSHPTGVGLGAILFGPSVMTVLAMIVLLFQALLLAHGGISTLGANLFSMGIAGPVVSYGIYLLSKKINVSKSCGIFFAAFLGNLTTYVVTSIQLGLAFPVEGSIIAAIGKFSGIFAITQIPLAVCEGLLTVVVYNLLTTYNLKELEELAMLKEGKTCL